MMMMYAAWQSMLTNVCPTWPFVIGNDKERWKLIDISCITQIQRLCSINVVL